MAGERRLYLGSDATDARYLIEDPGPDGDLVVTDLDDGNREVFRYDSVAQLLGVLDLEIESIVGASGTTVYDDSTETVGDGTTSANHESVSTGVVRSNINEGQYQAAIDGLVVPVGPGVGVEDAVDPSQTTTPIQDATDILHVDNGVGGKVVFSGHVVETETYSFRNGVEVVGIGRGNLADKTSPSGSLGKFGSVLEFADGVMPMTRLDADANVGKVGFKNLTIKGPGDDATQTTVMEFDETGIPSVNVENVTIRDVYGQVTNCLNSNGPFESSFRNVSVENVDAGDSDAIFHTDSLMRTNFENIAVYPTATTSGSLSQVYQCNGSQVDIDGLNMGGTTGRILEQTAQANGPVEVHSWNWEPAHNLSAGGSLFALRANGEIGVGRVNTVAIDPIDYSYVFALTDGANQEIRKPGWYGNAESNFDNVGILANAMVDTCWYFGETADWNANGQSSQLQCLSSAGTTL